MLKRVDPPRPPRRVSRLAGNRIDTCFCRSVTVKNTEDLQLEMVKKDSSLKMPDLFKTEHLATDLKGRSVRGGLATLTSQGAQFLISTASTVVLARLLTPADFGLVAMVTAITGLAAAF